jgi:DNA polymerase elongation subunit (family B)
VDRHRLAFAASLERALTDAYEQDAHSKRTATGAHAGSTAIHTYPVQYLYNVSLSKAVPFYGMHVQEHLFLRVSLVDPRNITRAVALLRNGAVMGRSFKVYESHIPFMMQFFVDNRIYGMDYVHLGAVSFRTPLPRAHIAR